MFVFDMIFLLCILQKSFTLLNAVSCNDAAPCTCDLKGFHGLKRVFCEGLNLKKIPEGLNDLDLLLIENDDLGSLTRITYSNLEFLNLDRDKIVSVAEDAFLSLQNLKGLSLEDNQISSFESVHLRNLSNLNQLNLKNNPLKTLSPGLFTSETVLKLERLDLSFCELTTSENIAFQNLKELKKLYMSFNFLEEFPIMIGLESLRVLDLEHNRISTIPNLSNLPKLKELRLAKNMIKTIDSNIFSDNTRLVSLNLAFNGIENIDKDAFTSLVDLNEIHINNNNLTTIDKRLFSVASIEKIHLQANPWNCDCYIKWMSTKPEIIEFNDMKEVKCASPSKLQNKTLIDADFGKCGETNHKGINIFLILFGTVVGIILAIFLVKFAISRAKRSAYKRTSMSLSTEDLTPGGPSA